MASGFLSRLRRFVRNEEGASTVMALFLGFSLLMFSGYAIDFSNAITTRTQMQVATDAAAHAALMAREFDTRDAAIAKALEMAERNMPANRNGYVIEAEDVLFGHFDQVSNTFTPDPDARNAVRVLAAAPRNAATRMATIFWPWQGSTASTSSPARSSSLTIRPACAKVSSPNTRSTCNRTTNTAPGSASTRTRRSR